METPAILRGDLLTRLLQGAAVGAVATLFIGFYWGGWVTGGSAKDMVQRSRDFGGRDCTLADLRSASFSAVPRPRQTWSS